MAPPIDGQIQMWLESVANERPWRYRWASRTVQDEDFLLNLRLLCDKYTEVQAFDLLVFLEGLRQEYTATRRTRHRLMTAARKLKRAQHELEGSLVYPLGRVSDEIKSALTQVLEPKDHRDTEDEIAACKADIVAYLKRREPKPKVKSKAKSKAAWKWNAYGWLLLRAVFGRTWRAGWGKDQIRAFSRLRPEEDLRRVKNRKDVERLVRTVKIDIARAESKQGR